MIKLPDGRWCVDFEVGDRSGETFLRLYERLPEAERYYSDDYGVYGSWLPAERRIVGKGKLANRNEGLHSEYRGRLKRLARATMGTRSRYGCCVVRWRCCVCVRVGAKNPMPARVENTEWRVAFRLAAFPTGWFDIYPSFRLTPARRAYG